MILAAGRRKTAHFELVACRRGQRVARLRSRKRCRSPHSTHRRCFVRRPRSLLLAISDVLPHARQRGAPFGSLRARRTRAAPRSSVLPDPRARTRH